MADRIVIVQGYPNPTNGHLCNAIADAYSEGAQAAGHFVTRIAISELNFPLLRSIRDPELPKALEGPKAALLAATHIVVVCYFWRATVLLRAFVQQIMRPRTAFQHRDVNIPPNLFKNKSARIIVVAGMPAFLYNILLYGRSNDVRTLKRDMLAVGIAPIRESLFGMPELAGATEIASWLTHMRGLGAGAS
jgi:putative NADPH-quinone reductase